MGSKRKIKEQTTTHVRSSRSNLTTIENMSLQTIRKKQINGQSFRCQSDGNLHRELYLPEGRNLQVVYSNRNSY